MHTHVLRKLANAIVRPVSTNFFHGNTKGFLKTGRKQMSLLSAGRKIWRKRGRSASPEFLGR